MENTLYYGDNLDILREYIPSESVDLVYLDPPFNSARNYNVLFKDEGGKYSEAQITAFEDTWHWTHETARTYHELVTESPERVSRMIAALRDLVGESEMGAYLVMMAARLVELHRVLKPTGSLYLHCDPTASHYLKIVLDTIFGPEQFRTEIVWKRSSAHSDTRQGRKQHGRIHDIILYYTKGNDWTWNPIYTPYDEEYIDTFYSHVEEDTGRRFALDNLTAAKPGGDTSYEWKGVKPYNGRYWAYSKAKMEEFDRQGRLYYTRTGMPRYKRYLDEMPGVPLQDVWSDIPPVGGLTAERLGYPTQKPLGGEGRTGKKGSDRGVDGVINFVDDNSGRPKRVLVQVKSGHVSARDIRDLRGTLEREEAQIGVFITLEEPTRDMQTEAAAAGFYTSPGWHQDYPRLQILTIEQLLHGAEVKMPPAYGTFKEAQRVRQQVAQGELELG